MIQPYHVQTAHQVSELPIVLAVGDTTYLDYKKIIAPREEYGPIGKGGNGLILHSTLAVNANNGQPLGWLWEKLWHRDHHKQKKKTRSSQEKESYRWVEALSEVQKLLSENQATTVTSPKVIHVFDREGDIAEVFEQVASNANTGLVVRAAHNRALTETSSYLWSEVTSLPETKSILKSMG